ncbi:hypothetical protein [Actomonas aquatica]|uniref:Lipase helper protein n=1 Tax=Actomonas aquatica TaxID=2866162 RepID=A0ABZ1CCC3_9BACT|nr:hypothetical protein [Opitutus sp. WL0086]WRQ88239.1 hypothetical protein K1X11_002395 [Opitutus sp. WL0086]
MPPILRFAVFASLIANAALGFFWWQHKSPPSASAASSSLSAATSASATTTDPSEAAQPDTAVITGAAIGPYLTDAALSDVDLVARLKAAGVPIDVIRQIIHARVHARFVDQWQALVDLRQQTPYWMSTRGIPTDLRRAVQALVRDERAARAASLGEDAFLPEENSFFSNTSAMTFLSAAKRAEVGQILGDYSDLQTDLMIESMGIFTASDREVLQFLHTEMQQELAALLTPEELAAFQIQAGNAAVDLQERISTFPATEAEYLRLLELYNAAIEPPLAMFRSAGLTQAEAQQREQQWRTLVEQFAAELPEERAALWTDSLDPRYSMIDSFSRQQGLDRDVTLQLVRLNRSLEEQQRAFFANGGDMSPTQRDLELTAIINRIEQDLGQILPNPETRNAWQSSVGGRQLQLLKRRLSRPRP